MKSGNARLKLTVTTIEGVQFFGSQQFMGGHQVSVCKLVTCENGSVSITNHLK